MTPIKVIIAQTASPIVNFLRGDKGAKGDAATISVGAVTTTDPGSPVTVINSGTEAAAVFDFGIPKGAKGDTGNTGAEGPQGPIGLPGTTTWSGITGKPTTLSGFGITDAINVNLLAAPSGVATLDAGGKLTTSQLPDIAIVEYLGAVASQAAMLALTGQKGDWATRTDLGSTWIITGNNPAIIGGWTQLSYPTAPVTSVAGKTGAVTLAKADVGLANVDNTSDASKPVSTAQAAADSTVATAAANALTAHSVAGGTAHPAATGSTAGFQSAADKTKLDGIANAATANSSDAYLLARANHTGSQPQSSVTNLVSDLAAMVTATTNVSATLSAHTSNTFNPHGTTKAQVGLGNADNTSDANKPVSTATQAELNVRLRFDAAQTLTFPQKDQGLANLGVTLSGGGGGSSDQGKVPIFSIGGSIFASSLVAVDPLGHGNLVLEAMSGNQGVLSPALITDQRDYYVPDKSGTFATTTDTITAQYGGLGGNFSAATGFVLLTAGSASAVGSTGTGNVARANSPTFVTPVLGVATGTSLELSGQAATNGTSAMTRDLVGVLSGSPRSPIAIHYPRISNEYNGSNQVAAIRGWSIYNHFNDVITPSSSIVRGTWGDVYASGATTNITFLFNGSVQAPMTCVVVFRVTANTNAGIYRFRGFNVIRNSNNLGVILDGNAGVNTSATVAAATTELCYVAWSQGATSTRYFIKTAAGEVSGTFADIYGSVGTGLFGEPFQIGAGRFGSAAGLEHVGIEILAGLSSINQLRAIVARTAAAFAYADP